MRFELSRSPVDLSRINGFSSLVLDRLEWESPRRSRNISKRREFPKSRRRRCSGSSIPRFVSRIALVVPQLMRDSQGLVAHNRGDKLPEHKRYLARDEPDAPRLRTLLEVVQHVKPTALLGLSTVGGTFTPEILKLMADLNEKPIVFALSNPVAQAECTFEEAVAGTNGKVLYASGSPFDSVMYQGMLKEPGQGNNMSVAFSQLTTQSLIVDVQVCLPGNRIIGNSRWCHFRTFSLPLTLPRLVLMLPRYADSRRPYPSRRARTCRLSHSGRAIPKSPLPGRRPNSRSDHHHRQDDHSIRTESRSRHQDRIAKHDRSRTRYLRSSADVSPSHRGSLSGESGRGRSCGLVTMRSRFVLVEICQFNAVPFVHSSRAVDRNARTRAKSQTVTKARTWENAMLITR